MPLLLILSASGFTVLILTSLGTPKFILTVISVSNLQFFFSPDPCSLLFGESWLLHWLLFRERLWQKRTLFHFKFFDCKLVALTSSGWASLEKHRTSEHMAIDSGQGGGALCLSYKWILFLEVSYFVLGGSCSVVQFCSILSFSLLFKMLEWQEFVTMLSNYWLYY